MAGTNLRDATAEFSIVSGCNSAHTLAESGSTGEETTDLRIADMVRPLIDTDVDLDEGRGGIALRWTGIETAVGCLADGAAGSS